MNEKGPVPRRWPSRLKRWGGGAIALCCAVYLLRGPLFGGLLRGAIEDGLADAAGGVWTVAGVEGSWVTDLTVLGVALEEAAADDALRAANVDRIELSLAPLDLLLHGARGVTAVTVRGLDLALGPAADGEGETDLAAALDAIPDPFPALDLEGVVRYAGPGGDEARAAVSIKGTGGRLAIDLTDARIPLAAAVLVQAEFGGVLERTAPRVLTWTSERTFGGVCPRRLRFAVDERGAWVLDGALESLGTTVALRADAERVAANATDLDLARLRELIGPWVSPETSLPERGSLDLDVAATIDPEAGVSVDLRCAARDLRIDGWVARLAEAKGTWSEAGLHVAEASGEIGSIRIRLSGADIDAADPWVVSGLTRATLETDDLLAALLELGASVDAEQFPSDSVSAHVIVTRPAGGRQAVLQSLEVTTPRSGVSASGAFELPATPADWRAADVSVTSRSNVAWADVHGFLPPAVRAREARGAVDLSVGLEGSLAAPELDLQVSGRDWIVGGQTVSAADLTGRLVWPELTVTTLSLAADRVEAQGEGRVNLETGAVGVARLRAVVHDLAVVSDWVPDAPAMAGSARLETTVDGPLVRPTREGESQQVAWEGLAGALDLDAEGVRVGDVELGSVQLEGNIENEVLTVAKVRANGPLAELEANGTFGLTSLDLHVPFLVAAVPDVSVVARWLPDLPSLEGALNVAGWVRKPGAARWREAAGKVELLTERLVIGELELEDVSLFARGGEGNFDVYRARITTPLGSFDATGSLQLEEDGVSGVIASLDAALNAGPATLLRPAPFVWREGWLTLPDVAARGRHGRVEGRVALGSELDVDLSFSGASLEHLDLDVGGRLSARVVATGPSEAPTVALTLRVPDLTWKGQGGALDLDARQDAGGWHVERMVVDAGEFLQLTGTAELPFVVGTGGVERVSGGTPHVDVHAVSGAPAPWMTLVAPEGMSAGAFALDVEAAGPRVNARLAAHDLRFSGDLHGLPGFLGVTVVNLEGDATGTRLSLERAAAGKVDAHGQARLGALGDWTDPVAAWERVRTGPLEGGVTFDTSALDAFVQSIPGVAYLAGRARGDIILGGTVEHPEVHGAVSLDDLTVRLEGDIPTLDRGRLRGRWEGDVLAIETFEGRLGYGAVRASGRVVFASDAGPELHLDVNGENALLARTRDLRLRSDVELHLAGPIDALSISGSMRVTDALYSQHMEFAGTSGASSNSMQIPGIRTGPLSRATFDVTVRADETVRVENNLVHGALSVDLRIRGTGVAPRPEGRVTCRDVKLTLPLSKLRVEQASAVFSPETDLDGRLQAIATTRMQGYDLSVHASGTLSDPRIEVSAIPSLTQEQAIVLLSTGVAPADAVQGGASRAALGKAAGLFGTTLFEWFTGHDPDAESVLEDATLEIGREQSEDLWSTIELEIPFGPGWFLRAERDRYGYYNAGVVRRYWYR